MPPQTPAQATLVDLTKALRASIRQEKLADVFRAAGATKIKSHAAAVLGETTATFLAPLLAQRRFEVPPYAGAPATLLVAAAREAVDLAKLKLAFKAAGIDPQQGQDLIAREMARIAQASAEFAHAEGRPVSSHSTAIGAARASTAIGPAPYPVQGPRVEPLVLPDLHDDRVEGPPAVLAPLVARLGARA